jgi:hypothetical protein
LVLDKAALAVPECRIRPQGGLGLVPCRRNRTREFMLMRRFLMLLAASATMLVVFASSAMAQQYPPAPQPAEGLTPGSAPAAGARGAGELAFTGSDLLPLIWIGLAVLVLGVALVVAARRRSAIRGRRVSEAIA